MRAAILVAVVGGSSVCATCALAQTENTYDKRVFTINIGRQPLAGRTTRYAGLNPAPSYSGPNARSATNALGGQSYIAPYSYQPDNYGAVYQSFLSPNGYGALGISRAQTYATPFGRSTPGYGSPAYVGQAPTYLNPYYGYPHYATYQGRRTSGGRMFGVYAQPTYRPWAGGMFDR